MLHKILAGLNALPYFCAHKVVSPLTENNAKHWRGAEPKRRQRRMKRGGSLVSKEVCRTAGKADDYCEPDRAREAQRDGVRLPYAPQNIGRA